MKLNDDDNTFIQITKYLAGDIDYKPSSIEIKVDNFVERLLIVTKKILKICQDNFKKYEKELLRFSWISILSLKEYFKHL